MNDLFTQIFKHYYDDVYRLVYSYSLNIQDTEDITQRTFIKLYKNINKFTCDDYHVKQWLFKVAINDCKDIFRNNWNRNKVNVDDLENIKSSNNKPSIMLDIPKKYRIPIYLYYYEGYKIKEISTMMKLTESAIKMRLKRGKELLRKEMEE